MAIKATAPHAVSLTDEVLDQLRAHFRGDLLQPGDQGYDEARRLWNAMIDKRPALIARCTGTADVVSAVNFAREHDIPVAVRGGGHNVAGNASIDDGLMIDLSPMRGVQIDPVRHTARVQPGANWGDLDHETQLHSLATPGGVVSTTGVAGFTLGGGIASISRKWGLACDNLLSVEVVTASGEVLHASTAEHSDLFWALRGGGGNFGIVTSFEFQLHAFGPEMYLAAYFYALDDAPELVRAWRDYIEEAPREVTSQAIFWGMPPLPGVEPDLVGDPIVILAYWYAGPPTEGEQVLAPVRHFGTPLVDLSHVGEYVNIQSDFDVFFPDTKRYYWKSLYSDTLSDEVIDAIVALAADRPSSEALLALRNLGGAISDVPEDATAYGNRQALYNLSLDTTWEDPHDDERMIAWTRDAWTRMHDLTGSGVYLNFAGLGEEEDNLAHAGYGTNYDRLVEVKRKYDPTNFFRGNINIAP